MWLMYITRMKPSRFVLRLELLLSESDYFLANSMSARNHMLRLGFLYTNRLSKIVLRLGKKKVYLFLAKL